MTKSIYEKKFITEAQAQAAAKKAGVAEIRKEGRFWVAVSPAKESARQMMDQWINEFEANIQACQSLNAIPALYDLLNAKKGLADSVREALDEAIGIRAEELEATQAVTGKPPKAAKPEKEWVRESAVEKPTKLVWFIADEMYEAAEVEGRPYPSRKEVQAECVRRGIASGTARTQFQHWFKCRKEMAEAARAKIEDGKIIPCK